MKELFRKRSADFNMIEDGFKKIEAFQMKKAQMEQELSDVRKKKSQFFKITIITC